MISLEENIREKLTYFAKENLSTKCGYRDTNETRFTTFLFSPQFIKQHLIFLSEWFVFSKTEFLLKLKPQNVAENILKNFTEMCSGSSLYPFSENKSMCESLNI